MPVLEAERPILRELTLDDLDDLCAWYRDPEVRRYCPEGIVTYAEICEELERIIDVDSAQYGFGLWATLVKENSRYEDEARREKARRVFYTVTSRAGILLHPNHDWFVSAAHTEADLQQTLNACADAFEAVREAV